MCACVFFLVYCVFCVACLPYWRINVLIIVIYVYFTYIFQGSVEMLLWYGGRYNNHVIAN